MKEILTHGSLFSGIGGFDLAAEWMGWENIFHCEWNQFGQKILKHYWPRAIAYEDITKTDFSVHRGKIDILTGGFPCQPYSTAGKRKGKEDDRHLWPEMLRAIREIAPAYVVGENVGGLLSWNGGLVFDEVQADLEVEGYEVQPFLLPAAGVGAPHKRDRIWFIAYAPSYRLQWSRKGPKIKTWAEPRYFREFQNRLERFCIYRPVTNTKGSCCEGELQCRSGEGEFGRCSFEDVADTDGRRQPCQEHRKEKPGRTAEKSLFNYWQDFPTQSPICDGDDGLSAKLDGITFPKWRNESIKGGGNAIVPQVAFQIFKSLKELG